MFSKLFTAATSTVRPKTINEKTLQEEVKLLEEKKQKIKSKYDIEIQEIEYKLQQCRTKENLSQDEQLNCRRMEHQKVDLHTQVQEQNQCPCKSHHIEHDRI